MGMKANDYLQTLLQLLPPGKAYPRDLQGVMASTLIALAEEFARIDARVDALVEEADPRTTLELLTDWERVLVLSEQDTVADRQRAITGKLTELGGQSRNYFMQLAAALGYAITITEYRPYTCVSPLDQGIYEETVRFVWQVNAPETTIDEATCRSPCIEPLRSWGNEMLESAISGKKPAHTTVIFSYGG